MSRQDEVTVEIRRLNHRRHLKVDAGDHSITLADWLSRHAAPLNTRCGQRGLCRGCEVELESGYVHDLKGARLEAPGSLKACQCRLAPETSIRLFVPEARLLGHHPQITTEYVIKVPFAHQPRFTPVNGRHLGAAIDLGTTTVALILVDLIDGRTLAVASRFNRQIETADNVLSRIQYAASSPARTLQLRDAVTHGTLQPLLLEACRQAGVAPADLAGMTVAGNTTMLHLLTGTDPAPLGIAPFQPVFLEGRAFAARDIGLGAVAPDCPVFLLPGLGSYVGADLTAGLFSTGMSYLRRTSLLVDVGTNGEIVLQHAGERSGCATAAGPAFEGSGLNCGSRAVHGAVSRLFFDPDSGLFRAETIGQLPLDEATGLCGSAYLDFLAEARAHGVINDRGRFESAWWNALSPSRRDQDEWGRALRLTSPAGHRLIISEADIAALLQAKAAIAAGILTLLELHGIGSAQVETLYLAGSFGRHLRLESAIRCGLLPGFTADQVEVVGNSSLGGALLALLDASVIPEMEAVRGQIRIVELNQTDCFEDHFIDQMSL